MVLSSAVASSSFEATQCREPTIGLHFDAGDEPEHAKREVEAVAYIVGRYFDLDTSGSAFYLAAWQDGDAAGIQERLGRISSAVQEIIGTVAED